MRTVLHCTRMLCYNVEHEAYAIPMGTDTHSFLTWVLVLQEEVTNENRFSLKVVKVTWSVYDGFMCLLQQRLRLLSNPTNLLSSFLYFDCNRILIFCLLSGNGRLSEAGPQEWFRWRVPVVEDVGGPTRLHVPRGHQAREHT